MNFDCRMCGASFAAGKSTARYCGDACRQRAKYKRDTGKPGPPVAPRLPAVACARCGKRMQTSHSSAASPTCRDCRRAIAAVWTAKRCDECGGAFTAEHRTRRFCSLSCASRNRLRLGIVGRPRPRTRPLEHPGVKRRHRERAAPGLTTAQRSHLLHKWQRDGRTCTYCGGACETVDHIIALVRGGTNYEGNLTPACRSCNGSKQDKTIIEWKHGRPAAQFNDSRPWMVLAA